MYLLDESSCKDILVQNVVPAVVLHQATVRLVVSLICKVKCIKRKDEMQFIATMKYNFYIQ